MIRQALTIVLVVSAGAGHTQDALKTYHCQQQAQHEYQLRIQAPPIFPEVYPGQNGGQAGQAAAYASVWSQRAFMECLEQMRQSKRPREDLR